MNDFHEQLLWFEEVEAKKIKLLKVRVAFFVFFGWLADFISKSLYEQNGQNVELRKELGLKTEELKDQQESRQDWEKRAIEAEDALVSLLPIPPPVRTRDDIY